MHYVSYTQETTFKEVSLVMNRIIVCKSNSKATTADMDFFFILRQLFFMLIVIDYIPKENDDF